MQRDTAMAPHRKLAQSGEFSRVKEKNFQLRRFVKRTETYPIRSRFVLSAVASRVRSWIDALGVEDLFNDFTKDDLD